MTLTDDSVLHLRASGNAPELRIYTEAQNPQSARALLESALQIIQRAVA